MKKKELTRGAQMHNILGALQNGYITRAEAESLIHKILGGLWLSGELSSPAFVELLTK